MLQRSDLSELRDALAARDAVEGASGEATAGIDDIMSRLRGIAADLKAVREGKHSGPKTGTANR